MEQFEQLLTCCVCLDRYRIPKLLPCQHSFCMEPCMEGLVDYVRRQVKCPECRAEHRIPYNGVQAFPTNVTLQRFLELHIEITGELPDPTSGQIMERCSVCSEKSYLSYCAHCEKKICEDCKSAHMDILRREITRFNSQIRRSLHRLQDTLAIIEKNTTSLQTNCVGVTEEIDEIYRRITKAIKDRTDQLRGEVDRYHTIEMRNLTTLKENLDLEIQNISGNCDIVDKYMNDTVEWDDCELMDTKEIFLKTVEFLRHFEYENADYTRRVRFLVSIDPNQLVMNLATFGDLNIAPHSQPSGSVSSSHLAPPSGLQPGLMRSKSDHRLATQFRQQEERVGYNDEPVLGGRKFGERPVRANNDRYGGGGDSNNSRYGRGADYDYENDYDNDQPTSRTGKSSRFRSRFVRSHQNEDSDSEQQETKRQQELEKKKDRVLSGEDVSRGQLSGIIRLSDCARVIQRLADIGKEKKEKKVDTAAQAAVQAAIQAQKASMQRPKQGAAAQRQVSEDDEISRIKRQNKNAPGGATTQASTVGPTAATTDSERPAADRVAALKRTGLGQGTSEESDSSNHASPSKAPVSAQVAAVKKTTRSGSSDSTASTESSTSSAAAAAPSSSRARESPARTRATPAATTNATGSSASSSGAATTEKKPFVSRFLPQHSSAATSNDKKKAESESSSEEETSTEESEDEVDTKTKTTAATTTSLAAKSPAGGSALSSTAGAGSSSSGASSYRERLEARRNSRDDASSRTSSSYATPSSSGTSGYGSSTRQRPVPAAHHAHDSDDRYGSGSAASGSRYSGYGGSDLARSRSSHALKSRDNSPITERPTRPAIVTAAGSSTSAAADSKDGEAMSSWARYLKNKYGNKIVKDTPSTSSSNASAVPSSSHSHGAGVGVGGSSSSSSGSSAAGRSHASDVSRRLSLGLPLRQANELASSDDDGSKNGVGSPTSPTVAAAAVAGITGAAGTSLRELYLRKRQQLFQLGGRGSEPGSFTWPRGVAVGPDNSFVVADSSNHRVQVFDSNGIFVKSFGEFGCREGEFDCLAGVAINRIGQYIIADRYNHRIQVLDPQGRFLRAFGSQGITDGKFNYPWGIATDSLGFIYVCDKENHRVQVFQSDGTFVGKFGKLGPLEGELEHPHYIAVSNTNRVIVSDSNNHRIQIFDVNGKVLKIIGSEGSDDGQLKFPRGIAVDDQGYIVIADAGNNRIQIYSPDGTFLKTFGSWGSGQTEFKGLEGVGIMSNGNILVCDRENHRVQVF
ncbi:RING finger protein nhl-1 isoform X4 [Ceratitis capitata]|uniref:RING finger protein nhl-1 isoform X4 n=1 Tax=Ceratitis capitata TaxID=7213 RepID=UPI000618857F|nr:RING finger protein nhl-1 isoform X4 [Ceratitis capitata]